MSKIDIIVYFIIQKLNSKLSKTNIFFSCFEGTRGEKKFAPKALERLLLCHGVLNN